MYKAEKYLKKSQKLQAKYGSIDSATVDKGKEKVDSILKKKK